MGFVGMLLFLICLETSKTAAVVFVILYALWSWEDPRTQIGKRRRD